MRLGGMVACMLAFSASSAAQEDTREDGRAPANTWHTSGGSAARTNAAATEVGDGPFVQAWEASASGRFVGPPLVWNDVLLVEQEGGPEQRSLLLLDLLTGKERSRQAFRSAVPLQPSLWGHVVVVRSGPRKLTALRVAAGTLEAFFEADFEEEVQRPLLVGDQVWVRVGESLAALRLWSRSPRWRVPGRFRGSISLRDGLLFAVAYRTPGVAVLQVLDSRSGEVLAVNELGHHGGRVPHADAVLEVSVHAQHVFVSMPLPVLVEGERTANTAVLQRGRPDLSNLGLINLVGRVAEEEGGWLGQTMHDGQRMLVQGHGVQGPQPLAAEEHHPEFLEGTRPIRTGRVALVGRHVVRRDTSRILAHLPVASDSLVVPARGTLLAATDFGRRLVAFREQAPGAREPRLFLPDWPEDGSDAVWEGRAVLRDGAVVEGALTLVGGAARDWSRCFLSALRNGRRMPVALHQVLWIETTEGELRYLGAGADLSRAVARLVEHDLAQAYVELAGQSLAANDPVLLAELLGEAVARGVEDSEDLRAAERTLAGWSANGGRAPRVNPVRAQAVQRLRVQVVQRPAELLWQRVVKLPEAAPWDVRVDLLRAVLEADESHQAARALVKALVPSEIQLPRDFRAQEWLTFVEAIRHAPIELVTESTTGPVLERLQHAQGHWRADLIGIQSPNLLVLTPLLEPGRVSRCLAAGELLCETLERMFGRAAVRAGPPMTLYLFSSEEEYRQKGGAGQDLLEWSAGHYAVAEGVSRLYLPADGDAFERVLPTLVHELTHQWLAERSAVGGGARGIRADVPGFWIVEGFATLMESFTVDLRRRRVSPPTQPASLDVLSLARPEQLLEWAQVLGVSQEQFGELDGRPDRLLATTQYLGVGRQLGAVGTYYIQAEALCQFLYHADGGRHRPQLIEAVRRFHSKANQGLDPKRDLGFTAVELGEQVLAFAREWGGPR